MSLIGPDGLTAGEKLQQLAEQKMRGNAEGVRSLTSDGRAEKVRRKKEVAEMKVAQLIYNWDTDRYELDGEGLHCGDCFEVLVVYSLTGKTEWIDTRIECTDEGWYLVGIDGYQICGLFARW